MVTLLKTDNLNDLKFELKKINVSSQGIDYMAKKGLAIPIKITDVKLGAANILKQEMLSIGGDCAVARGIVEGSIPISEVVLLGTVVDYEKLVAKLDFQPIFGLKDIQDSLRSLIKDYIKQNTLEPKIIGPKVMGILNVTPDSFSDGMKHIKQSDAVARAKQMIDEGCSILDIGGESSRPGSKPVSLAEELSRVIPVIKTIRTFSDIPISIDTTKSEVAEKAIESGVNIINDISALKFDKHMINVLRKYPHVPLIIMHMQGKPKTMQDKPYYDDTIAEVMDFFQERINYCVTNGIERSRLIIDPGIGFGKRYKDNLLILKKLEEFKSFGLPVLLGASRKRFINKIYESSPNQRLMGSIATTAQAFNQRIDYIRVHDVKEHVRFLKSMIAIRDANELFDT